MGLIPDTIIAQILERTDIVSLIQHYTPLTKAGRNFKALCPFHNEKSPSFVVNPDKQIFHCFGCGAGGNALGFVMKQEGLTFPQALQLLAEKAGVVIPEVDDGLSQESKKLKESVYEVNQMAMEYFHQQLLTSRTDLAKQAREYLKNRGVSLDTVKIFKLGLSGQDWDELTRFLSKSGINESLIVKAGLAINREKSQGCYDRFRERVMFPILDVQSRCVAFGARTLKESDGAKYINSPETPVYTKGQHLFGLSLCKGAIGKLDRVIVVEGYMDMIMPYIAGVPNIVAALGTALTVEQIRLIRRYTRQVIMLFDTDRAGQSAMIRSLDSLIDENMNVQVATLDAGDDPDSYIRRHGVQAFHERLDNPQSLFDYKWSWLANQVASQSVEGKAFISQHMMATIQRYRDEVVKYQLKEQLAKRLEIPVVILDKNQKTVEAKATPLVKKQPIQAPVRLDKAQETLLTIMLNDFSFVAQAKQRLQITDDYWHPQSRMILSVLWSMDETAVLTLGQVLELVPEEARALVSRLGNTDNAQWQDKQRLFDDCIKYIEQLRLNHRRENLQTALKQAQDAGDGQSVDEILKQMNELIKLKVKVD